MCPPTVLPKTEPSYHLQKLHDFGLELCGLVWEYSKAEAITILRRT